MTLQLWQVICDLKGESSLSERTRLFWIAVFCSCLIPTLVWQKKDFPFCLVAVRLGKGHWSLYQSWGNKAKALSGTVSGRTKQERMRSLMMSALLFQLSFTRNAACGERKKHVSLPQGAITHTSLTSTLQISLFFLTHRLSFLFPWPLHILKRSQTPTLRHALQWRQLLTSQ